MNPAHSDRAQLSPDNTTRPTIVAAPSPNRSNRLWSLFLLPLLMATIGLFSNFGDAVAYHGVAVEVIVNQSVTTRSMSKYKLRTLFGMRQPAWPDGEQVRVFVLPDDNPLHRQFAKQTLGVFPHQLRRAWNNLLFSGLAQAPTEVANEQEMLERIANTPGAVGYAPAGEEHAQTHILSIR